MKKKIFGLAIGLAILALGSVDASAAEPICVDRIDEYTLQEAMMSAVTNELDEITIQVTHTVQDNELNNITAMLGDIKNLWTYRQPDVFNYTRDTKLQVLHYEDSFDITLVLGHGDGIDIETAYAQKKASEDKAQEIYNQIVADGMIPEDASELYIARVLLDWVCNNISYLNDNTDTCHTAYSAFFNKTAVCDGYTSAYNLLLKAAGIHCYGVKGWAGGLHEWTAAILDGELVYIDSTWCDVNDEAGTIDLTWFAVKPSEMANHTAYYM